MGYSTDFRGQFKLDHPLKEEHAAYLHAFAGTRRMMRHPDKAMRIADPKRNAVGLPIGDDGEYFVGGGGYAGQEQDDSIVDYNRAPGSQPGLWCKWEPNKDGTAIEWNGVEKFYDYIEWLQYIVDRFLKPWGYVLNGEVLWQGEDIEDRGRITVQNNSVSSRETP